MDLFEVIKKRRSVRAYIDKKVEDDKLRIILEAANSAPSAGDLQAYEIVVVKDNEQKEALSKAARGQNFIAQAPVALVLVANQKKSATRYSERGAKLYSIQDATIAGSYIQLAATALGLATCWVGSYDDKSAAKVIGADMQEGMVPVAIIPIGYTTESPSPRPRREMSDLAHQGKL